MFFANLMPWLIFVQTISFVLFMQDLQESYNSQATEWFNELKDDAYKTDWKGVADAKI